MLAFSGCDYGGGEKERIELGAMRKRWKTLHVRFLFHTILCYQYFQKYLIYLVTFYNVEK